MRKTRYRLKRIKNSPNWYITWSENRKPKRCTTGTANRAEADIVFANFLLELEQPEKRTPDKLLITVALDDYMMEHASKIASKDTVGFHRQHLVSYFGDRLISYITPNAVQGYIEQRQADGIQAGTIRRELTTLSAALHHARKQGRLSEVPFIKMPSAPRGKERWLTQQEAADLLDACKSPHMRLFCHLALHTGQRKGAILDLTWFQVDFARRTINFNPPDRKETNKRRAVVPMNDYLFEVLKQAKADTAERDAKKKTTTTHVISYKGKPVTEVRIAFKRAAIRAGLYTWGKSPGGKKVKITDVTPHTLRHTAGSWMAQAGVDMYIISQALGHSLGATTARYAHLHPNHMRKGMDVLASCALFAHKQEKSEIKTVTRGRRKQG